MPDAPDEAQGGAGGPTGAVDLNLIARAIRQDWPIPPKVKRKLLQNAIDIADPDDGAKTSKRTRLAALRVIGAFGQLTVNQAKLDLAREKFEREKAAEAAIRPDRDGAPRIAIPGADDGRS